MMSARPASRGVTIRRVGEPGFYPIVVFDLDGTLLRGTSVSLLLAQWLGQTEEIAELEQAFHAHRDIQ